MKVTLKNAKKELDVMFGTDAEFFLQDTEGNIVPASKVIPGLKHDPHHLEYGVCHPDGLSLEVGCPPSDTSEGMLMNLFKVINEVKSKFLDPAGLTIAPVMAVDSSKVKGAGRDDLEFGCSSEFDAYNQDMMKVSDRDVNQTARYSGFHIHLGYTEGQESNHFTFLDSCRLVRVLDDLVEKYKLGTTSGRANQYGGRGAFRVKPYGIEYRCMDCSVITNPSKFSRLLAMLEELPSKMESCL